VTEALSARLPGPALAGEPLGGQIVAEQVDAVACHDLFTVDDTSSWAAEKGRTGMIRTLIAFVIGFVVAALLGSHVYLGSSTGVVLWYCGPQIEVSGHPGVAPTACR
jgi:hypothetical protein